MDTNASREVAAKFIESGASPCSWGVIENAPPVTPPTGYISGRHTPSDAATVAEALRTWDLEECVDNGSMRHFRLRNGDRLAGVNVPLSAFAEHGLQ
jgi:hypothetical protein